MSEIKGGRLGRNGRLLTPAENAAWAEYESILNYYHRIYHIKAYDRASVHEAFPEIKEAFERIRSLDTYYALKGKYDYGDGDEDGKIAL